MGRSGACVCSSRAPASGTRVLPDFSSPGGSWTHASHKANAATPAAMRSVLPRAESAKQPGHFRSAPELDACYTPAVRAPAPDTAATYLAAVGRSFFMFSVSGWNGPYLCCSAGAPSTYGPKAASTGLFQRAGKSLSRPALTGRGWLST